MEGVYKGRNSGDGALIGLWIDGNVSLWFY